MFHTRMNIKNAFLVIKLTWKLDGMVLGLFLLGNIKRFRIWGTVKISHSVLAAARWSVSFTNFPKFGIA